MTSRFIANSHSFPPTLTSCGYVKSECGHEVAVPGYSGLQQPPKPSQDENNPKREALAPEVTHQALKPVCLLSPELFTAMNQSRSLLLPRGKQWGF